MSAVAEAFLSSIGTVMGICVLLTGLPRVLQILQTKSIGDVNGAPYTMLFENSIGWTIYGCLVQDQGVFILNAVGTVVSGFYFLVYHEYAQESDRVLNRLIFIVFSSGHVFTGYVCTFMLNGDVPKSALAFGLFSCVCLVTFYAAPLKVVVTVIRARSARSLDPYLSVFTFCNSSIWAAYGYVKSDPFIYLPNTAGSALCFFQLALIGYFWTSDRQVNRSGQAPDPLSPDDFEEDHLDHSGAGVVALPFLDRDGSVGAGNSTSYTTEKTAIVTDNGGAEKFNV